MDLNEIIEKLSPIEIKVIPYLNLPIEKIVDKSGLDFTSVLRALKFLEDKEVILLKIKTKKVVNLGVNGIYYKKNGLPERKLLLSLENKKNISLEEAKKISKLSDNEFKASLGILKGKALLSIKNGKISISTSKEEIVKKSLEEQLLENLPINLENLSDEQKLAFNNLKNRKNIIEINDIKTTSFTLSDLGRELAGMDIKNNYIEEVTSEIIKSGPKGKKFRKYNITSSVPQIYGGKKHFVNQAIDYARNIWTDLGFKEMSGTLNQSSFWNFDALFTAQDHPVRDLQDTFYLKDVKSKLPNTKLIKAVKQAHELGVSGSKGWQYDWDPEDAKKTVLRTHTTCLSAQTLSSLKKSDLPAKFFSIGKNFRNETVDWSHGFEFYQTEGIVVDNSVTFRHLLGYLQEFYKKMGFEKVRFTPAYFPYTEPSVEVSVYHNEKNIWLELGGAGVFRPEITVPLLGTKIPVLAWGQGFDRIIMDYYKIKDLRTLYMNDIKDLRNKGAWLR